MSCVARSLRSTKQSVYKGWLIRGRRPSLLVMSAVLAIVAIGCSGGSAESQRDHLIQWCDLVEDAGSALADAERTGRRQPPDADPEVIDAYQRVVEHGWPEELRETQNVLQGGLPPDGGNRERYVAAVRRTGSFMRDRCDLDPELARYLFEGGGPPG